MVAKKIHKVASRKYKLGPKAKSYMAKKAASKKAPSKKSASKKVSKKSSPSKKSASKKSASKAQIAKVIKSVKESIATQEPGYGFDYSHFLKQLNKKKSSSKKVSKKSKKSGKSYAQKLLASGAFKTTTLADRARRSDLRQTAVKAQQEETLKRRAKSLVKDPSAKNFAQTILDVIGDKWGTASYADRARRSNLRQSSRLRK